MSPGRWRAAKRRDVETYLYLARLQVHPAIIAGKVRYERQNHRLLSQFVGTGEVRRQFGMAA